MGSKVLEIVKINDNDDDNDGGQISLLYETTPISHVKGTSEDNPIVVEDYDENDEDVLVINTRKLLKGESSNSKFEEQHVIITEEDSIYPPVFMCEICADPKPIHNMFRVKGCDHCYCSECMAKYVACRIQENITHVTCPFSGCSGLLEPQCCREILPRQVFDRWGDALCEAVILASEKFYCPFKDCSALLIDDRMYGEEVIKQSECPYCWRLFCVQCKVPWHPDIECVEFQKLNKDEREKEDILLMELAKSKNWMRCPKCQFYVERSDGCLFIKCRCAYTFCYSCGAYLKEHYCTTCKR